MPAARCEVCGNEYDKAFQVTMRGASQTFDSFECAIQLARAAGARVVLDPAPARQLAEEVLQDLLIIRPNAAEAEVLTGIKVTDRASATKAAENLLRRGVGAAIVGAPGGNLLLFVDGELWLDQVPVKAVDSTGAGDAFAGALAASTARGEDLPTATRFANAAAALKTTALGAQAGLPTREAVMRLLSESDAAPAPT